MNIGSFISHLPQYTLYLVVFLVIISVLVAAHELGHYLFARLFGMGVEEFAIGFGKRPILHWGKRTYEVPLPASDLTPVGPHLIESGGNNLEGGVQMREVEVVEHSGTKFLRETTVFTVRPYPLGGFVRIKGMMPQEDGGEVNVPGGLYSKPPWQRLIVLFAGPAFSVIAGILLLIPVLMIDGIPDFNAPVLGDMNKDSAGYKAGLRPDDRVKSIGDVPINNFYEMVEIVRVSEKKALKFTIDRKGVEKVFDVTPILAAKPINQLGPDMLPTGEMKIVAVIGVSPAGPRSPASFSRAVAEAVDMPIKTVIGLGKVFSKPQTITDQVGGPATMVVATANAVEGGFAQIIIIAAMLSISVGIMNLLPIFPLDGGQMAVAIAEMIRGGKRLSMGVQNAVGTVGFMLVAMLIVTVLFSDFKRFVPNGGRSNEPPINVARSGDK